MSDASGDNQWWSRAGLVLVPVLLLGLLAAGCAKSEPNNGQAGPDTVLRQDQNRVEAAEKPVPGGKIVYGLRGETNGWNPATNQWAPSGLQVAHALFDTLSAFDDQSQIHPYLAKSFDHNADYTEWTINLRPGVKLHNGKVVDSEVVRRNEEYLKTSPVTGGIYSYVTSYSTNGPDKFVVKLNEPWVNLPMVWSTQVGVIADPDWLESNDGLHPIGTGPFALQEWQIGNKLTVSKNLDYWQLDKDGTRYPYLDAIEFRVITDGSSRTSTLTSSGADIIELNEAEAILSFKRDDQGYQVFSNNEIETLENFVMLNTAKEPFDDPDARRAMALATDVKTFNEIDSQGLWEAADGPFKPGSPWYTPSGYPSFNLVAAKDLVSKVKARHGGKFEFKLVSISEPAVVKSMQVLQQQWQEAGIDVTLVSEEQAKLIIEVISGQYQSTLWQQFAAPYPMVDSIWWSPDSVTPIPQLSLNFARNTNKAIGEALRVGRQTTDKQTEIAAYQTVSKELAKDIPYIWLNHNQFTIVASPKLVNVMNWVMPDGAKGIQLNQDAHMVHQIWQKR